MALFSWNSQLDTGNEIVDNQHRRLFALVDRLSSAVVGREALPVISVVFFELATYADTHFRDEEKLLSQSNLTQTAKSRHIRAHRAFSRDILRMSTERDLSQADAVNEVLEFLVRWLVTHILGMDQRMIRALPSQGSVARRTERRRVSVQQTLITALIETERRFRLLAEQAPTLIWFCGVSGDRDFVNKKWRETIGLTNEQVSLVEWVSWLFPDDRPPYEKFLQDRLRTNSPGEIEYRIKAADGTWRWMIEQVAPRMNGDDCVGLVAATTDVSTLRSATETLERLVDDRTAQLEAQARTDSLTGLFNRRVFDERLRIEIDRAHRYGRHLSLLFCDIDRFKAINDQYGHSFGDDILVSVAKCLRSSLRGTDVVTRFGGEEFAVILPETTLRSAVPVAETIREKVYGLEIPLHPIGVTISIGVATLADDDTVSSFVSRADKAMYAAKNSGRNKVVSLDGLDLEPFDIDWSVEESTSSEA